MRKILLIALVSLIAASMAGCSFIDGFFTKDVSIGDQILGEYSEREGAVMEFVSYSDNALTVTIKNNTDYAWQSGNMRDYRLEVERDGQWYQVKQIGEFANTMELMIFAPSNSLTHTFNFTERYGTLTAGKYRVVKSWWANSQNEDEKGSFDLWCEFEI